MLSDTLIFSLTRNQELTKEVCSILGLQQGDVSVNTFADGETLIEINQSVRGKNVYIIQSTSAPANSSYMELLIMIDAVKRASANSINIIMPYYGYSRQDRKAKPRQPITSRLVADMLQVAGANRVLAFDLHAPQIQGFFTVPIDDIYGLPLLASHFKDNPDFEGEDLVIVSPDHGGATRARNLGKLLDAPIAIIDKRRPRPNEMEVMNIIGEVEGKTAIIIDDMIDTAGTICAGAQAIRDRGAKKVYAACTHAILSDPATQRLLDSVIEYVVTTNTIELSEDKKTDKIKVLSVAPIIAAIIDHIENKKPVSDAVKFG